MDKNKLNNESDKMSNQQSDTPPYETYIVPITCNNCGDRDQYEIQKGLRIENAFLKCNRCGCRL